MDRQYSGISVPILRHSLDCSFAVIECDGVIHPMSFQGWIFFVKAHARYLDCPTDWADLLVHPIAEFVFPVFLGQRNPLTAEMSSVICAKISFTFIIRKIISTFFE